MYIDLNMIRPSTMEEILEDVQTVLEDGEATHFELAIADYVAKKMSQELVNSGFPG